MGRNPGIRLSKRQFRALQRFAGQTKDKKEYRAATGLLSRGAGKSAEDVAFQFSVTRKQVFMWTSKYRNNGIRGLKIKKQTGRPATAGNKAKEIIPRLIEKRPKDFGYLKGAWVLRDISRELENEGVKLHFTSVRRILDDLGLGLKSPKLRAPGSIRKNYKARAKIRAYKRVAAALLKKRSQ